MPTSTGRIRAGEPSPPWKWRANSNYNSLQVALRATAWKNLTLNTSYTWSHAFDIIDGEIFSNVSNPFNARWDYGPAGFDRRQIFVTSFIYQIPFFRNSASRAAKALLGGWELSGIALFESGTPTSASAPAPTTLGYGGGTTNRANVVAPVTYPKTRTQWFSTSSFAKPGPLQWGTSARNTVVTPGRNNWNIALFKAFQFTGRRPVRVPGGNLQYLQPHAVQRSEHRRDQHRLRTTHRYLHSARLPVWREDAVVSRVTGKSTDARLPGFPAR